MQFFKQKLSVSNVYFILRCRLKNPLDEKPLVVMLCWLQARQKHIEKYAELYVDQGLDVLAVQITPWQLLWPTKGTQLVAKDVINFLHANTTAYNPLFLHGFSVGGYMWGECLVHVEKDLPKFQSVIDRIIGQVFDSAADVSEIHIGIPKAVFPKNPKMQAALRSYIIYHMKAFHEPATSHYIRSSQMFHGNLVRAPALMFVSKMDPVGPPKSNARVRDNWIQNNVPMTYKVFEKSPHVGHFQMYRDEYVAYLMNHLKLVNLIKDSEKIRAKL